MKYILSLTVLSVAVFFPAFVSAQENEGSLAEGIEEIIEVVDDVAQDGVPPQPAVLPDMPLPLGNAPDAVADQPILTPDTNPVDLTRTVKPEELSSLFFTFWEHNAIKDARNAVGHVRAPTDAELMVPDKEGLERIRPPPDQREIKLGGIVYNRKGHWTIWLNGQRITPDALPREIMELRVFSEYVELKWLDEYTRQIFPIRLRPHQRFNMDSRIFLPG